MLIIDKKIFESKTKNGMRAIFEVEGYELVDSNEIIETEVLKHHFLIDYTNDKVYSMCLEEAYELLSVYVCKDTANKRLMELIQENIELGF
ncbi:hypothetical protein [Clostridium saccharobutylicum]|uniref:Uncharacterized protein n=1 Tax=Clostridium saccharobutylicum TaxID=169679 RepID=A0A1S8MZ68_CLOSA|nr:hypothetical protein [Clostridium saccharobutylicum]OOM09445.1 hypothetical protein CLOSAC_37260 [Clostridium saccharobutylicum]